MPYQSGIADSEHPQKHDIDTSLSTDVIIAVQPTSSVDEYSVAVNAWVQRAPLKLPRSSPAASYLDGQIMVFGGQAACKDPASCLKSYVTCTYPPPIPPRTIQLI